QTAYDDRVATATMNARMGAAGTYVMALAIMISAFGCNNGLILTGARILYAMARDGLFFARAGTTNAHRVPAVALWAQGIWAALSPLPGPATTDPDPGTVKYGNVYSQLLEYIVTADLIFFALMVAAVIVMRRKAPDRPRPYRVAAYPLLPLAYLAVVVLL